MSSLSDRWRKCLACDQFFLSPFSKADVKFSCWQDHRKVGRRKETLLDKEQSTKNTCFFLHLKKLKKQKTKTKQTNNTLTSSVDYQWTLIYAYDDSPGSFLSPAKYGALKSAFPLFLSSFFCHCLHSVEMRYGVGIVNAEKEKEIWDRIALGEQEARRGAAASAPPRCTQKGSVFPVQF